MHKHCKNCGTELIPTKDGRAIRCPMWKPKNRGCKGDYVRIPKKVVARKKQDITPNSHQQAILNWYATAKAGQNLLVNADAGTGKTTTLALLSWAIPSYKSLVYLAFGSENKKEAENGGNFAPHCRIKTFHGEAFAALRKLRTKVDNSKIYKYMDGLELAKQLIAETIQIVGYYKNLLLVPSDENYEYVKERFGLAIESNETELKQWTKEIYQWSLKATKTIDFNDMLTLPILLDMPTKKYDVILVDEMQDQNPARIALLKKLMHPETILMMVGDEKQAIMGFTGAAYNGMTEYQRIFNADTLPLAITWRNSQAVLDFIKSQFDVKTVTMNQAQGTVSDEDRDLVAGDLVLCRNNAPLIAPCMELIKQGKPAYIKGKDIAGQLKNVVYRHVYNLAASVNEFWGNYGEWLNKLYEHGISKNAQARIADTEQTITAIIEHGECQTARDIVTTIDKIFKQSKNAVVFSTMHKSKGLESDTVVIIEPDLLPSGYAVTEDQIKQEHDLWYVAITRGKTSLHILGQVGSFVPDQN